MLRPPSDMLDLMHTVARYIELEEYIRGPSSAEVADSTKPVVKE